MSKRTTLLAKLVKLNSRSAKQKLQKLNIYDLIELNNYLKYLLGGACKLFYVYENMYHMSDNVDIDTIIEGMFYGHLHSLDTHCYYANNRINNITGHSDFDYDDLYNAIQLTTNSRICHGH